MPQRLHDVAANPVASRSRRTATTPAPSTWSPESTGSRAFTTTFDNGSHDSLLNIPSPFLAPHQSRSNNQTKFHIITNSRFQSQSSGFVQAVLERLRWIIGDSQPLQQHSASETDIVRTPLRILPGATHLHGGNMIAFQVYNASRAQRDAIVHSLEDLPEVNYCGYEGPEDREY